MQIATQQFTNIRSIILARQKFRVLAPQVCVNVSERERERISSGHMRNVYRYKGINSNYFVMLIKPVRAH